MRWGTETALVEWFGPRASDIRCARRMFNFRYRSAEHWVDMFRTYYGPTHKAFAALAPPQQSELQGALLALLSRANRARDATRLVIPGEYLEAVIVKA